MAIAEENKNNELADNENLENSCDDSVDTLPEEDALDEQTPEEAEGGLEEEAEASSEAEAAEVCEESETDAGCDEDEQADGSEEKKERRFFKKKKDKKDEKIEELNDRLMRQMAEFDNYRKRTDKEKAANYVIGAKDVIEKLLPVVDNFERGLEGADLSDPFSDGMNKIYKQLLTLLADMGVEPIEAVGKEFNPDFHNAVMHVDDEEVGENIIVEEFQKGYTYKELVVRHSMVKVAN